MSVVNPTSVALCALLQGVCLLSSSAATLRSGNAEFEESANRCARDIAVRRLQSETAERGLVAGELAKAMKADPKRYAKTNDAERLCRALYAEALKRQYEAAAQRIARELGVPPDEAKEVPQLLERTAAAYFAAAYAAERAACVAEQARSLVVTMRPSERDIEQQDEATLLRTMSEKIAAGQSTAVFEENRRYISESLVAPVLASAKKERERQRQYVMRTACEGYAPERIARELEEKVRRNVAERRKKAADPAEAWEVFPSVLETVVPQAASKRALERAARCVDDVAVSVDAAALEKRIAKNRGGHRRKADSERIFRTDFTVETLNGAIAASEREAPAAERAAFSAHVRAHAKDSVLAKAVDARLRRDLLPLLDAARASYAKKEARRLWPALAEGTWFPSADLADATAARSDYAACVRDWRTMPDLAPFAAAERAEPLEETSALADRAVASAFERGRSAISSQNAILTAVTPQILEEAKRLQASFWRRTPDFAKIVDMLTNAVRDEWNRTKVATLWPEGPRPKNASEQHAEIFPSVRRRIELVARTILDEMAEDKTPVEETSEETEPEFSIVVKREGEAVSIRLDQGGKTLFEKKPKARHSSFESAMRELSDKLGKDILKLP